MRTSDFFSVAVGTVTDQLVDMGPVLISAPLFTVAYSSVRRLFSSLMFQLALTRNARTDLTRVRTASGAPLMMRDANK